MSHPLVTLRLMAGNQKGAWTRAAANAGITYDEYAAHMAAGEKRCMRCKQWKPLDAYNIDNSRPDRRNPSCQQCTRVKERKSTKGRVSTFKGRKHTPEALAKMREAALGRPSGRLGKKHTAESRARMSATLKAHGPRGENHYNWQGGKTPEHIKIRKSDEYAAWRTAVFERDGYACRKCGDDRGGNLHAHHIKSFADYPDDRFDVDNGATLCKTCHMEHHRGTWPITDLLPTADEGQRAVIAAWDTAQHG